MASDEPFIGEIALFATFVPRGWLACDGSVLPITQYSALFSVITNRFGGDGVTNFALPDLRGRVVVGTGDGPGLTPVSLSDKFGADAVALTPSQTAHGHALQRKAATSVAQKTNSISANANPAQVARQYDVAGNQWELVPHFLTNTNPNTTLGSASIGQSGTVGGPHNNCQPFVGLQYAIACAGHFPHRP